ncbi:hypothetical protein HAX54_043564, partial [Datura stramonium]|nr:hypothetical protein [Datura stramonium]
GTTVEVEFQLQRDRRSGRSVHCSSGRKVVEVHHSETMVAIADLQQRESDHCTGQREAGRLFKSIFQSFHPIILRHEV